MCRNSFFLDNCWLSNQEWVRSPVTLHVPELTSDSIRANAVFPESFAFSFFMLLLLTGSLYQFMPAMCKPAFLTVVAVTKFWKCLAQFSLVLKRVCFYLANILSDFLLSIWTTVTFSGTGLCGFLPD